jgi:hypothetical protein
MFKTPSDLPKSISQLLLNSHRLANNSEYQTHKQGDANCAFIPKLALTKVIWATDQYDELGPSYEFGDPVHDLSIIVSRLYKSKEIQKKRSSGKGEVFTPSWVCNLQNNLIDEKVLYPNCFNTTSQDNRFWYATPRINFNDSYSWMDYIAEHRLEITCGEAPYLTSPVDTYSGKPIPLVDAHSNFNRIGLLDRKLRVISENFQNSSLSWHESALIAYRATYGFEWQGDSLILARFNLLNSYCEYFRYVHDKDPTVGQMSEIAEIISWNLWQMDGLRMVIPASCSNTCDGCRRKLTQGHDGTLSVIRNQDELIVFAEVTNE